MSEETYGQIPVFYADKEPIYPGNEKDYEKALKAGGSRHYIPKHYPRRVYRYLQSGEVETNIANDAEHFQSLLGDGWSGTPLAPPLPPPAKDVTKAEYEANMRTAKAELQNDELRKQLNEVLAMLKEKDAAPSKSKGKKSEEDSA
jgi:hypothetical protein